jgi:hypothetical protein
MEALMTYKKLFEELARVASTIFGKLETKRKERKDVNMVGLSSTV